MKKNLCFLIAICCLVLLFSCELNVHENIENDKIVDTDTNESSENNIQDEHDDADKYPYLKFVAQKTFYSVGAKDCNDMP